MPGLPNQARASLSASTQNPVGPAPEARVPPQIPAEAGNRSCCAQPPAACIAGLWTAPLPAQSSPASQKSGDGGLSGKKIALDLQLADLAVQIVNDLLRIPDRRRPVAARTQQTLQLHGTVQGNLDPVLLIAGGAALDEAVRGLRRVLGEWPYYA